MPTNKQNRFWKIAKPLLLVLVVLTACFFLGSLFLPSTFQVQRSTLIQAPISSIFAQVNSPRASTQWSPWKKEDPSMTFQYNAIQEGKGASYNWVSKTCGEGSQTIVESVPNQFVKANIIFNQGNVLQNLWTLTQQNHLVKVTWSIQGDVGTDPFNRYMILFVDDIIGHRFETGLKELKTHTESKTSFEPS